MAGPIPAPGVTPAQLDSAIAGAVADGAAAPASRGVGSGWGFELTSTDAGHFFLGYAPNGDLVASLPLSTGGRGMGKSSDNGATWTTLGTPDTGQPPSTLWVSAAGTWFTSASGKLYRSADSGATWAAVNTCGTLLGEGFTDAGGGVLYTGEYLGDARIFKSTDDGLTWALLFNFPNTDNNDPGAIIRHVHGIRALPSGLWVMTGDDNTQCGLWKWDGATFARQSPAVSNADGAQRWRTVGLEERGGWLYWIQDGSSPNGEQPAIVKADPADLAGTLTILATLPSGGWYTATLATGEILFGSVFEDGPGRQLDRMARLWLVDNADTVHEVWSSERIGTAVSDFTAPKNLAVRASDGLVSFLINQTDWTGPGSSKYATVSGRVVPGSRPVVMTPNATPRAYASQSRAWTHPPVTTSSPTYAGGAYADIPELAVKVASAAARPLFVALNMDARCSIAGQYVTYRLILQNDLTGGVVQVGQALSYGAQTYGTMSISGLVTPAAPGSYTLKAQWLTSGGATAETRFGWRTLTVIEP